MFFAVIGIWFPVLEISVGPLAMNLSEVALLLLACVLVVGNAHHRQLGRWSLVSLLGFLALATLTALQLVFVSDAQAAFGVFLKFVLSAVFILSLVSSEHRPEITNFLVRTFCLAGSVSLLVANLDYFFGVASGLTYAQLGDRRSYGFFEHANQYAIWIVTLVPVVILFTRNRVYALAALANISLALFLTGSKFNLAVFFVIVWFSLGLRWRLRFPTLALAALPLFAFAYSGAISLILYVMGSLNPEYAVKVERAFEDPLNTRSFLERLDLWTSAMKYGSESPILGIGGGQAYTVLEYSHAHNLILQYFLTYGLLGLVTLLVVFFAAIVASLTGKARNLLEYRLKCAMALVLAGLLMSNQFSDSMASQQILLFGIIVGITLSLYEERLKLSRGSDLSSGWLAKDGGT